MSNIVKTQPDERTLRTKCRRWYGAMIRKDRDTWVELLDSEFNWFPRKVAARLELAETDEIEWSVCLDKATAEELQELFYCIENSRISKRLRL